jgi:hypothetical protein
VGMWGVPSVYIIYSDFHFWIRVSVSCIIIGTQASELVCSALLLVFTINCISSIPSRALRGNIHHMPIRVAGYARTPLRAIENARLCGVDFNGRSGKRRSSYQLA